MFFQHQTGILLTSEQTVNTCPKSDLLILLICKLSFVIQFLVLVTSGFYLLQMQESP